MNPYAPAHYQEEMERANRRMSLLVRIAELRKVVKTAELEGKAFVAESCLRDIALHEEELDNLMWESAVQLNLF